MSVVPVPPKIPGTAVFSAADIQRLKIGDSLVVVGDITCDSLTAVTTITAGTGFTATTGNIVATTGNITATAGSVNSATGGILGSGASSSTRIGTGAGALVGFYGATAVVRPTTAIAAAAFVANTSGIADDTATFGGYTLGKVVAALQTVGILT